jgi:hypothetical protein
LAPPDRNGALRPSRALILVALTVWLALLPACGIGSSIGRIADSTEQAVLSINDGISGLNSASADWQKIVGDLQQDLIKQGQSTLANEVSVVLSRAVAATGAELRCNVDFVRVRIRQDLIGIRDKLLGLPTLAPEPALCDVVPLAVDRSLIPARLNRLEFYGYDFDTTQIQVLLDNSGGSVDESGKLARPTHYHMTLNLGGNGVQLGPTSQRLRLRWNGKDISSISVIQPATPVCESKTVPFTHPPMTFIPPHARGDREFKGHGPRVSSQVSLAIVGDRVDVTTTMTARETESDWTTASGSRTTTFFTADPGWRVEKIVEPAVSSFSYVDTDNAGDQFGSGGGPVSQWDFIGDSDGNDAGVNTRVTAHFRSIHFLVTQTGNCVSPHALQTARTRGLIGPEALTRFDAPLRRVPAEILRLPSGALTP